MNWRRLTPSMVGVPAMQRVEAVVAAPVASGAAALVALSAACGNPHSFDHLVGEREQLVGNDDAERLGGLEIDYHLELSRLQHRQIGRLLALEDPAGVDTNLPHCIGKAGPIAH